MYGRVLHRKQGMRGHRVGTRTQIRTKIVHAFSSSTPLSCQHYPGGILVTERPSNRISPVVPLAPAQPEKQQSVG